MQNVIMSYEIARLQDTPAERTNQNRGKCYDYRTDVRPCRTGVVALAAPLPAGTELTPTNGKHEP
jgi:hypothetical protein